MRTGSRIEQVELVLLAFACVLALVLPFLAGAVTREDSLQERLDARSSEVMQRVCDHFMQLNVRGGLHIPLPSFCTPTPPPPPIDVCPNVPGLQESGPCADIECTEDGGTWDGDSCEMPPPPPTDQCPNVPGIQESEPCADAECVEDGGTWNGESCDMPPPPPTDVCPNVPGDQAEGPCADEECEADGGSWNGTECVMPPVDVCANVPGTQEEGLCADEVCEDEGGTWDGTECDMPEEGSVSINEIMYDLPNADGTREWIEIMNGSDEPVDLSDWVLFESETNRALTLVMGNVVLSAGDFAVVVNNSVSFLADWPDFEGTLFDTTSFTLVNTGETLVLKNGAGNTIDEVTYSPDDGADGDGNSLQKIEDDWVDAPPTPGAANALPDAL